MKRSSKAALLSGLIFPGTGHIFLRRYLRGSILVALSLAALSVMVSNAYEQAQLVADQIISGEVSMEVGAISQAVADSADAPGNLGDNVPALVLLACWVAGIIDSYRLGAMQEKSDL